MRFAPGTEIFVGAPAQSPSDLFVKAVTEQLQITPDVVWGYVFNMVVGTESPRLMVGLVADPSWPEEGFRALMVRVQQAAQPLISADAYIDFMRLDPTHPLTRAIHSTVAPFYQRQSG